MSILIILVFSMFLAASLPEIAAKEATIRIRIATEAASWDATVMTVAIKSLSDKFGPGRRANSSPNAACSVIRSAALLNWVNSSFSGRVAVSPSFSPGSAPHAGVIVLQQRPTKSTQSAEKRCNFA